MYDIFIPFKRSRDIHNLNVNATIWPITVLVKSSLLSSKLYQEIATRLLWFHCPSFQSNQLIATTILIEPASHNTVDIPTELRLSQPPTRPPVKIITTLAALRFLFTFLDNGAQSFGSEARSQYTLVRTVVGISLKPRSLLVTIWPPLWNASNDSAIISMKWVSDPCSVRIPLGSGTTRPWTKAAATKMQRLCIRNESERVPLFFAPICLDDAKKKQPVRKNRTEINDLSQPYGCVAGCPEAPRARKIVFPVCMLTKHVHALYALLSQRPEHRQQVIIGISAYPKLISVRI